MQRVGQSSHPCLPNATSPPHPTNTPPHNVAPAQTSANIRNQAPTVTVVIVSPTHKRMSASKDRSKPTNKSGFPYKLDSCYTDLVSLQPLQTVRLPLKPNAQRSKMDPRNQVDRRVGCGRRQLFLQQRGRGEFYPPCERSGCGEGGGGETETGWGLKKLFFYRLLCTTMGMPPRG